MPKAIPLKMGPPPGEKQYRAVAVETAKAKPQDRTVEIAFSSEAPVVRWWGIEILSHDPGAMDLSRMQNGAADLLNHTSDKQIGQVEESGCDSGKTGPATVRFSRSALGEEVFRDVADGIRRNVSVG